MGQKVNPNSFNIQRKNLNNFFNSFDTNHNYFFLYKEIFLIRNTFFHFFENQNFIIKDCFFIFNTVNLKIYLYISFLPLIFQLKKKEKKQKKKKIYLLKYLQKF